MEGSSNTTSNKYDPFYLNNFFIKEHPELKTIRFHSNIYYLVCLIWKVIHQFFSLAFKTKWLGGPSMAQLRNKYEDSVIILSLTNNNRNAVRSIKKELDQRNIKQMEITSLMHNTMFPSWKCFFFSVSKICLFWKEFINKENEERAIVSHYFIYYLFSYGYVKCFSDLIVDNNIKCVLFSNDHIGANRALEYICKDNNVPSIYIQHASVSDYYPDLNFSYSFLDGLDSFIKYVENKTFDSVPVIFGAIRYSDLKKNRKSDNTLKNTIGIAVNVIDTEEVVSDLCRSIENGFPDIKIIIRAHPNLLKRPFHIEGKNVEYINAVEEPILDFFNRIDVLVSNDSTIHLDAIEFGLVSIKYNLSAEGFSDQYSYVDKGLIKNCEKPVELLSFLRNPGLAKSDPSIVRYYDHSYLQDYELRLDEIIATFISNEFNEKVLLDNGFHSEYTQNGIRFFTY